MPCSACGTRSSAEPPRAPPRLSRPDDADPVGWCLVALTLAAGALVADQAGPSANAVLEWRPDHALAEPWRAWSAAWVHLSPRHLLANLVGAGLVAGLGCAARMTRRAVLAWALAWPLTHLGLLAQPALAHYGGMSGVLHAGVAVIALGLCLQVSTRSRAVGMSLLAGLVAKLLLEAPWDGPLRHSSAWDFAVAPGAHVSGSLMGLLGAALLLGPSAWQRRRQPRMRRTSDVVE